MAAVALLLGQSPAAPPPPPVPGQVVTYHGGPVLTRVAVQGLYWGAGWNKKPVLASQRGQLEGFLTFIVNSSYMDQLTTAGYTDGNGTPIGRGTSTAGKMDPATLSASVTDADMQKEVQNRIKDGTLADADSQRLYVVFVDQNVVVNTSFGSSAKNFAGYHSSFAGSNRAGRPLPVYYAVIPYPGGANAMAEPSLPIIQNLTEVISHELAEAVTDPAVNAKPAWFADGKNFPDGKSEEIGDITRFIPNHTVLLNGFLVQKVSDRFGKPLTPASSNPGPLTRRKL
jgi:hypothetical protein